MAGSAGNKHSFALDTRSLAALHFFTNGIRDVVFWVSDVGVWPKKCGA